MNQNNLQYEYFMIQTFINSQDFTNIQILIITRILMKIFLIKFIRAAKQGKISQDSEKALKTLIDYHNVIKDDLGVIEEMLKKQSNSQWINLPFYNVDQEVEKGFVA